MKILVLGGSRLLGLALVQRLIADSHELTVVSRRAARVPAGARAIEAERSAGLHEVEDARFDIVLDFLAYDGASLSLGLAATHGLYVVISSVWMVRLCRNGRADELVAHPDDDAMRALPDVTRRYLLGKLETERTAMAARNAGRDVAVVRMPIFWGRHEHTGRIRFYAERLRDGHPLFLVDGGENLTQIGWVDDLAKGLARLLTTDCRDRLLWEALPHDGISVRQVVTDIAAGADSPLLSEGVESSLLREQLPEYLEAEPLWRECGIARTPSNVFTVTETMLTAQSEWLPACVADAAGEPRLDLRGRELAVLDRLRR